MTNISKRFITLAALTGLLLTPVLASAPAYAAPVDDAKQGACLASPDECNKDPSERIASVLRSVISLFSLVVGFVSVIMIMVGGFKYVTSSGDSNSISSAKNTIIYALVGLAVVALAQFIVRFVLAKVG